MENQLSYRPTAIKYAIILGLFQFGYNAFLVELGKSLDPFLWIYLSLFIIINTYIFAFREFRSMNGNALSFKQGRNLGTILALVAASIYYIFQYFYVTYIDDRSVLLQIEAVKEFIKQAPDFFPDNELAIEEFSKTVRSASQYISNTILFTFLGFLLSLITAKLMKREPMNGEFDN